MAWALMYLHGVGQRVHTDDWYHALSDALALHGIEVPRLQSRRIVVPTYVDLLKDPRHPTVQSPPRTKPFDGNSVERMSEHAEYLRRQGEAAADLPGTTDRQGFNGFGANLDPTTAPLPGAAADLRDARRYTQEPNLRSAILHRVITEIGTQRELIVVGHSLGSIVAIDLLAHLPAGVRVKRLITIGSPAGAPGFHKQTPDRLLQAKDFPYHQVEGWVNLYSPNDAVTVGRGITSLFPAAVDVPIELPVLKHSAAAYLKHPAVGKVLTDAMRPAVRISPSTNDLDVPLTRDEGLAVDQVLFAAMVRDRINAKSERRERFALALRHVASEVGRELIAQREHAGQSVPFGLRSLHSGDLDGLSLSPRSLPEQLLFAIVAGTGNPIAPFDIKVEKERTEAVQNLWVGYGYPAGDSAKVVAALKDAEDIFDGDDTWKRIAIGATGLAILAVPPVGIALGGAGLAGGAALTAGLAAFGPGGMIGGMALAGGLISVGSSAFATSVARPGAMSPDMLQTHVTRFLAFGKAMKDLSIHSRPSEGWRTLSSWQAEVNSELDVALLFSDSNSPTVRTLRKKLAILNKALEWIVEEGLIPAIAED